MAIVNRVKELVDVDPRFKDKDGRVNLQLVAAATGLQHNTVSKWYRGLVTRSDFQTLEIWGKLLNASVLVWETEQ